MSKKEDRLDDTDDKMLSDLSDYIDDIRYDNEIPFDERIESAKKSIRHLIIADRKKRDLQARIEELKTTVFDPMAGKTWLDIRPDIELRRQYARLDELKQELEQL